MLKSITAFLTLLSLLITASVFADIPLTENGTALYTIIIPEEATAPETNAAKELSEYLTQITGAPFETVTENNATEKKGLYIGKTVRAAQNIDFDTLKFEEIRILTDSDGSLILAGEGTRGTLYAVYTFLQDLCGVRWWARGETFVPRNAGLTIPDNLNIVHAPVLISRSVYHRDARDPDFSRHMKLNSHFHEIPDEWGGHDTILNWCHSYDKYLPPSKYFEDHPEWYSEIDGQRTATQAQICVTNEEMTAEFIKNVLQALRDNPRTTIIDVSQNDNMSYCQCEKCAALDEAEGTHAAANLMFINKVADAVAREFPHVFVETLAYQYTRKAPKTIRPRDNVLIRLCTIECSWLYPMFHEQNKEFNADMQDWKAISKQLFIWDYVTNYRDYVGPFPNRYTLGPNLKYFVENRSIGLFEEAEGDDFAEMRNWVLSRLAWDPSLDPEALFDEFQKGYYGKAVAPFIQEYWDTLVNRAREVNLYCGCFCCDTSQWIDLATINKATEIMNKAVQTAEQVYGPDSDSLRRLLKSKMAIDLVWLRQYLQLKIESHKKKMPFYGPEDPYQSVDDFVMKCKTYQTTELVIEQQGDFENYFNGLKSDYFVYDNPPEFCRNLEPDRYYTFDAIRFRNVHNQGEIVDDPEGWNGKSVRMGTTVDWNIQLFPPLDGKYRIMLSLRCEGTQREGELGHVGVYHDDHNVSLISLTPEMFLDENGQFDPKFRWIDMGTVDLPAGAFLWFSHAHDPNLKAIYTDRVVFLSEE